MKKEKRVTELNFRQRALDQPERTFWISKAFTSDKGHDLEIRFYRDNKIKAWKYSYDELCPRPVSSKELTADEFALVCAFSNDFLRNVVTASEVLNHEKDLQKEKKTLKM